jgi:dynein heavy chain
LIKKDFEEKYPILVEMMNREMDIAKEIYDQQMSVKQDNGKIPIHKNMPTVTGGLKWAQELRERISIPMANFKHLEHPYVFYIKVLV